MTEKKVHKPVYSYELSERQYRMITAIHIEKGNNPPVVLSITDLGDSYVAYGFSVFTMLISKDWKHTRLGVGSIEETIRNGLSEFATESSMRLSEPACVITDKMFGKFLLDRGSFLTLLKVDDRYFVNSNYDQRVYG
jgi:hypothetical protein